MIVEFLAFVGAVAAGIATVIAVGYRQWYMLAGALCVFVFCVWWLVRPL